MEIREVPVEGWERVVEVKDAGADLHAIISIHDASLGPACGGCRMYPYASFEAALEDVKNLSRGMSFKNALGGIPFGGGKSVIIGDPKADKTPKLFKAFGRALNELDGAYYTAQDSGVSDEDLRYISEASKYVGGIGRDGIGGNPGPFTARGVWRGIQASARKKLGSTSLKDVRVAIKGIGSVGMALARLLHDEGAVLTVADVNKDAVEHAAKQFGASIVPPEEAHAVEADVFSPCALGGAINSATIDDLQCAIVAGAANNQLKTPDMGEKLHERGILYAPDFVINAAGVISVGLEILEQWTPEALNSRIDRIAETLTQIYLRAEKEDKPTGVIADQMALEIISEARKAA